MSQNAPRTYENHLLNLLGSSIPDISTNILTIYSVETLENLCQTMYMYIMVSTQNSTADFHVSKNRLILMVSFCDRPMSVIHNFFKHLLLLNHWANLDETWQGCSLGEALPKVFKRLNSNHNFGCHGNQNEKKKQNL